MRIFFRNPKKFTTVLNAAANCIYIKKQIDMDMSALNLRVYCAEKFKAQAFAKKYFDENGRWPSYMETEAAKRLSEEEMNSTELSVRAMKYAKNAEESAPETGDNTEEQESAAQSVVEQIMNGEKNITSESEIKNISIPADAPVSASITAPLADGAYIKSESTKYMTVINTSEEPVDVAVESKGTVYLSGKFNDIYLNGKLSVASSRYPEVNGTVTVDPSVSGNVSVSAKFADGAAVEYMGDSKVSVTNAGEPADVTVNAPNATVEMRGKYGTMEASVSDDTLILMQNFHADKLDVKKGNVMFYGPYIEEFVGELSIPENFSAYPFTMEVGNGNISKIASNGGVYNVAEDVENTSSVAFGAFANGKRRLNLNGHTLSIGNTRTGAIFMRGSASMEIFGEGSIVNPNGGYGIWVASNDCVLDIRGGEFAASTHTIYVEKGTANIYGGTFRMIGDYDKDAAGRSKFMLNCNDSGYSAGTAKINVYGGKFYNFNPAESYGEPGGPVSLLGEGYHVVESVEDGEPVFEVVKD
jgi:hypothetical protein